jgi:hypothetical protein
MMQSTIFLFIIGVIKSEAFVHPLVKDNFTAFLDQNPIAVVEFYAPW